MAAETLPGPRRDGPKSALLSRLGVRDGEWRRVGLLLTYSVAATAGVLSLGNSVASALFLARLPASATPFLFLLPGISGMVLLLSYSALAPRVPFTRMVVGSSLLLAVVCLGLRALLETAARGSFALLASIFLFQETAASLVLLQFWATAGRVLDARAARRLFGLVALGGTFGQAVVGLLVGPLARLVGVPNLLFPMAAALVVAAGCAWRLNAGVIEHDASSRPGRESLHGDLRSVLSTPLLAVVLTLTVLQALVVNLGALQFYLGLQARFAGADQALVSFHGLFTFCSGALAILAQLLLTPYVLGRWGSAAAVAVYPLAAAASAISVAASGGSLLSIAALRGTDPAFRRTINEAGMSALILPVLPGLRARAKMIFGAAYAITLTGLGAVYLATWGSNGPSRAALTVAIVVLSALWLGLVPAARRLYVGGLREGLRHRTIDVEDAGRALADPAAISVVARSLLGADEARAVHALELLRGEAALCDELAVALLKHPSARVQALALERLGRPANYSALDESRRMLASADPLVRLAAIEAVSAITGEAPNGGAAGFLDGHPLERAAVLRGLIRNGGYRAEHHPAVLALAQSSEAEARVAAASLLAASRNEGTPALTRLLHDSDPVVRRAAALAVSADHDDLAPELLALLAKPGCSVEVEEALARVAAGLEPRLAALLAGGGEAAVRAARVLGQLATTEARTTLAEQARHDEEGVRTAACAALAAARIEACQVPLVRSALIAEVGRAAAEQARLADLGEELTRSLLGEALRQRLERTFERIFCLLEALHPGVGLDRARRAFSQEDPAARALAIELLDSVSPVEDRAMLVPLLERQPGHSPPGVRREHEGERLAVAERLTELTADRDPWVRASALHLLAGRGRSGALALIARALDDPADLVRETALAVAGGMMEAEAFQQLLRQHREDPAFPRTASFALARLPLGASL